MPRATRKALAEDAPSRSSPRASTRASTAAAGSSTPAKTRGGRRSAAQDEPKAQEVVESKTRGRSSSRAKATPAPPPSRQSRSKGRGGAAAEKKTVTPSPKRGRGKAKKEEPAEEEEEIENEEEEKEEEEAEEEKEVTPKRGRGRAQDKGKSPATAAKTTPPARGSRSSRRGTPAEEEKEVTPRGKAPTTTPPSRGRRGRGAGEPEEEKEREENKEEVDAEEEKTGEKGDTKNAEGEGANVAEKEKELVTADAEMKSEAQASTTEALNETTSTAVESQAAESVEDKKERAAAAENDKAEAETPMEQAEKAESQAKEETHAPVTEAPAVPVTHEEPMEEEAPAVAVPEPPAGRNGDAEIAPSPPKPSMKRKLEYDESSVETPKPDAKRARVNGTETENTAEGVDADIQMKKAASIQEESDIAKDYVVVNKEEVPAPDSAEVQAAIPRLKVSKPAKDDAMEVDDKTAVDAGASGAESVTVVPLTEAEVAKAYASEVQATETDDVSSTIVEVGSVAGSDGAGLSRGLDISELQSASNSIDGDHAADISLNESSAVSETAAGFVLPTVQNQVSNRSNAEVSEPVPVPSHSPAPAPAVTQTAVSNNDSSSVPVVAQVPMSAEPQEPSPMNQPATSSAPASAKTESIPVQNSQPSVPLAKGSSSVKESLGNPDPVFLSKYSSSGILNRAYVPNPAVPADSVAPENKFSIVSYNILAECHRLKSDYSYTPSEFLGQEYRHCLMLKELQYLNGDIVCLQEVGTNYFNVLLPTMRALGYDGLMKCRTKEGFDEGEATFYKCSKFELEASKGVSLAEAAHKEMLDGNLKPEVSAAINKHLDRADVVLITRLRCKATGNVVTVGNIHVVWDHLKSPDVQCIQAACAIREVVSVSGSVGAHIVCGDFNSEWSSPVYQLVLDGYLSDSSIHSLQALQNLELSDGATSLVNHLWRAFQHTSSNLRSAYSTVTNSEPEVTSFTRHMKKTVDFVFFSANFLVPVGVLKTLDKPVIDASGGLPSKYIPSDHLSMKADMAFIK